ncbi:Nmad3 family putative nucleotide modification protein [Marinobacter mobilis]|uniref:Nucleotide modification associated domain-containing protein n=1 Tax=Marinobacter mobilis TaxID=488533 RepID=A0A1H2XZW0_9GAMM|nr:hypothetical protein [Marinobacter mobilis]SDW98437.1 hypothetical protein SAMN04487960_105216 [Marinobacter mobilis]
MRLILSRKGFDSSAGGCPSPLFPDGSVYALPIPDARSRIRYREIRHQGLNVADLVAGLSGDCKRRGQGAHLDPDLIAAAYPREPGWRPLLGQSGAAQSHLRNQGVGVGDLFLFFGLFRAAEKVGRQWRFVKGSKAFHGFWGWLQVGQIVTVDQLAPEALPWVRYHPHLHGEADPNNTLYLAAERLQVAGAEGDLPGAGIFRRMSDGHRLTATAAPSPTHWQLPTGFFPGAGRVPLSYHHNPDRWQLDDAVCHLKAAARGQEFVLDMAAYPDLKSWLAGLFV